jgi:hypothetical protein
LLPPFVDCQCQIPNRPIDQPDHALPVYRLIQPFVGGGGRIGLTGAVSTLPEYRS